MAWFRKKENTHAYLGLIPAKRVKVNRLHRLANWLDNWHFTRVTASLSSLALILTLPMLWIDLFDRYEQRNNQAWQLVTAKATGNSGKRQALEYLNKSIFFFKEKSPLVGINLSDVYLRNVELPGADLRNAILMGSDLSGADLSGAYLMNADLSGAILRNVDLRNVDLSGAYLMSAYLRNVDLSGAMLMGAFLMNADLSGAILEEVTGLTQNALDNACGNKETILPEGLTIKPCQLY